MKVLVTGSMGVIGKQLVNKLRQKGDEVVGCDLKHAWGEVGFSQRMSYEKNDYVRCDISEHRQVERLMNLQKFDMIFNCAAEFGRWNGEDYYEQVWKTNVIGLKHLLNYVSDDCRLVHFSTSEVYGDYNDVMSENTLDGIAIKQMNDYALSKRTNELQIYNHAFKDNITIVRLFNVYGVGEHYHPYRSVHSKFMYHALKGLPIDLYCGVRSSTYIDDAINAIANINGNNKNRLYNIGSSSAHSNDDLVEIIWEITGASRKLINKKGIEKSTTRSKLCDNKRAAEDLGYTDSVGLKEGIERTVNWMAKWI